MKRLLIIFLAVAFATVSAFASSVSVSSGEQTSDALVCSGPCFIRAVEVITDGTNNAKLVIYDSTTASGTVVFEMTVVGASHYGGRGWVAPLKMNNGIYCDITGTGASYIVEF